MANWSEWMNVGGDYVRLIGDGKYNFSVYSSTNAVNYVASINENGSVTFYVKGNTTNGARGVAIFATDEYIDLTKLNKIFGICTWGHTSSFSGNFILHLIDEEGNITQVADSSLAAVSSRLGVTWDISSYAGKYRIAFETRTWSYTTGYSQEYVQINATDMMIV